MTFYTYQVSIGLDGNAVPSADTCNAVLSAVTADATNSKPGSLEVVGTLEASNLNDAGETMRGVLNRVNYILRGDGYHAKSEGWTIEEAEDPDDYGASLVNEHPEHKRAKGRKVSTVNLPDAP